jgi:hypothetical protein
VERYLFAQEEKAFVESMRMRVRRPNDITSSGTLAPGVAQLLIYCLLITKQLDIVPDVETKEIIARERRVSGVPTANAPTISTTPPLAATAPPPGSSSLFPTNPAIFASAIPTAPPPMTEHTNQTVPAPKPGLPQPMAVLPNAAPVPSVGSAPPNAKSVPPRAKNAALGRVQLQSRQVAKPAGLVEEQVSNVRKDPRHSTPAMAQITKEQIAAAIAAR